jgi:hypothetical protein
MGDDPRNCGSGQLASGLLPVVTDTATEGCCLVDLFHNPEPVVHLSLNQGTTGTRLELKRDTPDVLREHA